MKELKQLRKAFEKAPIDSITPQVVAQYRDARTAKVRANREIALLSHMFTIAREWGLTNNANPCFGVRRNKETPRDYYAGDIVWCRVRRSRTGTQGRYGPCLLDWPAPRRRAESGDH